MSTKRKQKRKKKRREFNWLTRLNQLVKRKTPLPGPELISLENKACAWPTCACGQLCMSLPRDYGGRPYDSLLQKYGDEFSIDILTQNWKSALGIFKQIEKRTALLLKVAKS